MPNYVTASRTKDHFQAQLLRDYPEIVSIAPRLKLDARGQLTGEAVIVVGVRRINRIRYGVGTTIRPQPAPIPDRLPAVTASGVLDASQTVEVVIEEEGEIRHTLSPQAANS